MPLSGSGLPRLVGRQRQVVALPPTGHTVVLGTAGSGKSTMAVHRAAFLSSLDTNHGGNTLLVTYNRSLSTFLRSLAGGVENGPKIEHYHRFIMGYLSKMGRLGWNHICSAEETRYLIVSARKELQSQGQLKITNALSEENFIDELNWLARHGFVKVDDCYQALVSRQFDDSTAEMMARELFETRATYRKLRKATGKRYDWDDIATAGKQTFQRDETPRLYRHIVIDEGQDFSPEMIRSLVAALPEAGSLTFFGDAAQQIYGRRISWRESTLEVDEESIWLFRENYRNTRQIARLALAITEMPYYRGIADMVAPVAPAADGPLPVLQVFQREGEEVAFSAETARRLGTNQSVGIICFNRSIARQISSAIPEAVEIGKRLLKWSNQPGVFVGTCNSMKGLEFDTVIIPFLSAARLPQPGLVKAFGLNEAESRDGRLLYVAITRARSGLILTSTNGVTPLLPEASGLYQEVRS